MRFSFFTSLLAVLVRAASTEGKNVPFPDVIDLPVEFFPEGIDIGDGYDVYVGSISTGAIWKGNLQDGTGDILVSETDNPNPINGVKYDKRARSLYAAGRDSGKGYRFDGDTGKPLDPGVFDFIGIDDGIDKGYINDLVITKNAVYFTDSRNPQLYVLPLSNQGEIVGEIEILELGCHFEFEPWVEDLDGIVVTRNINANGIVSTTYDGNTLIVVNSFTGKLYTVNATDGCATDIDLGGAYVKGTDGLVLTGRTLYAVQNRANKIAKIALAPDFASGVVVDELMNPAFNVPTTAALFSNSLYTPNAKFGKGGGNPGTMYEIVRTNLS